MSLFICPHPLQRETCLVKEQFSLGVNINIEGKDLHISFYL